MREEYLFHWNEGGYNSVYAISIEEAKEKAKEMERPDGKYPLTIDWSTFRKGDSSVHSYLCR